MNTDEKMMVDTQIRDCKLLYLLESERTKTDSENWI